MPGKKERFLALAKPDEYGFSRPVPIAELEEAGLGFGNGGDWCRDDGSLAREFNVERVKEKNRIVAVQLHGKKKNPIRKPVPAHVKAEMSKRKCAVLHTGEPQCDHKDGRRDDPRMNNPGEVTEDDFQPLSRAANNAKRQHCKECRKTNRRFDAKVLGYRKGQWAGNGRYMGTCVGCYWHDPRRFNQEASKNWRERWDLPPGAKPEIAVSP